MKKQSVSVYPVTGLPLQSLVVTGKSAMQKEKKAPAVTPPDEEKITRLNNLAKESPFCFYFKERNNDFL